MANDRSNLQSMLDDMEHAPAGFRPTNFWDQGLAPIVEDLDRLGFASFRSHPSAQGYYVPGYARPGYRRHQRLIDRSLALLPARRADTIRAVLDGRQIAAADARLVVATDRPGGLDVRAVSESDVGGGEAHVADGRRVSRSLLNYSRALTLLKRHEDTSSLSSILEIGGGYGTLGEILLTARPDDGFYVDVDIPPVAAVATYYLAEVFGRDAVLTYEQSRSMDEIDLDELRSRYRAVVLCPWQLPRVRGRVDLFANFISFQEMEPDVVAGYCELVAPLTDRYVLLRNSATGKQQAAAGQLGVLEPVTTDFVIERFDDFELLGRDSTVHGDESPDRTFRSEVVALRRRRDR